MYISLYIYIYIYILFYCACYMYIYIYICTHISWLRQSKFRTTFLSRQKRSKQHWFKAANAVTFDTVCAVRTSACTSLWDADYPLRSKYCLFI